jgi:release factor glutamine methyltransferase
MARVESKAVTDLSRTATVDSARRALAARFKTAGIGAAEFEARMLIGAVLGLDLTGLIVASARKLTQQEGEQLDEFARRRIGGEPVARILGVREFWGLPLRLSADTLVPRPDTETVVEAALQVLRGLPARANLTIADVGTGSGAILLALLHEWPCAFGVGIDINVAALRTARGNAVLLGLADRAAFVAGDFCAALSGPFDLMVSNPPYIRSDEIAALDAEVRDHDPLRALDGGVDGLDAYRRIIPDAARLLGRNGALVVEVGQGQHEDVAALMLAAGLTIAEPPKPDLAGILRAVTGWNTGR